MKLAIIVVKCKTNNGLWEPVICLVTPYTGDTSYQAQVISLHYMVMYS